MRSSPNRRAHMRLRVLLNSKIHRLRVTDKNLQYEGSLQLDEKLLSAAGILPGEVVQVVNLNNGERFETYVIVGDTGECVLNGGAARLGEIGDELIVMSTVLVEESAALQHHPRLIYVDRQNRVVSDSHSPRGR